MAAFEAKMGIELEMLLTERYRHMRGMRRDIEWFGYQVALAYNQLDRSNYPKMRCRMNVAFNRNNLHEWLLTDDLSLEPSFPDQCMDSFIFPIDTKQSIPVFMPGLARARPNQLLMNS